MVVVLSAIVLALSGPGQTAGIAVFVDHIVTDLDLSRSTVATAYMIGTLVGAVTLPWLGRAVDRYGVQRVLALTATTFGAFLVVLAFATEVFGLTAGFVGARAMGQGGMTLVATTAVAISVTRRRGTMLGITSALGVAGISLFPLLSERVITLIGWRHTFMAEALLIWVVVLPIALWGLRGVGATRQHDVGALAEGETDHALPLRQIARTSMFWALTAGVACSGLVTTAVFFHQIAVLGELGLSPVQAAANFLPQTLAGVAATLLFSSAGDRYSPKLLMSAAMAMHALTLALLPLVSPGASALAYGVALGAAAAAARAVEKTALPHYFGTANLGALRGLTQSVAVASTAVGPLLLSVAHQVAGSYRPGVIVLAALCALVALTTPLARDPRATAPAASSTGLRDEHRTRPPASVQGAP
ncbi:MFS transporter [Nocardiopsis sp. Huas11]|uniref:MFS transporter n=1 Tax=Nocardiopsis sp. Huas11 TaxID=2183912 RepID=UPI001F18141B|nr:MFS transporter [Nocardiopsis sp. Huas11]